MTKPTVKTADPVAVRKAEIRSLISQLMQNKSGISVRLPAGVTVESLPDLQAEYKQLTR